LLAILGLLASLKSLSALAGLTAGIVILLIAWRDGARFYKTAATLTGVGCFIIPLIAHSWLAPAKIAAALPWLPLSSVHRLYIWQFSAVKAFEKPLTGWGLRASKYMPGGHDQIPALGNLQYLPLHSHNSVLQILLELGIPGLLLFTTLLVYLVRLIGRQPIDASLKATCLALMTAYVTIGFTAFGIWQYWWISAGLLASGAMIHLVQCDKAGRFTCLRHV
jgi:O-antigen ligase